MLFDMIQLSTNSRGEEQMATNQIKLKVNIEKANGGWKVSTWTFDKKTGSTLSQRYNGTYLTLKEANEAKRNIKNCYFG